MIRSSFYMAGIAGALCIWAAACSATTGHRVFGEGGGGESGDDAENSNVGAGAGSPTTSGDDDIDLVTTGVGSGMGACNSPLDADGDGDGFRGTDGDCNDCDPNVNPGAIDVIITEAGEDGGVAEAADENCDGELDNVLPACDDGIALDDLDPMNAARAIDICQTVPANGKSWGVLGARYVRASGAQANPTREVGIFDSFGANVNVQHGQRMLALSSGYARTPGQSGACGNLSCFTSGAGSAPPGFPQDVPNCPGASTINDDVGLEVTLRAPTNATGYSFDFDFYSFEFPEWVCTSYNDQFIALVSPPPAGSIDGNISFDSQKNPVSVNIAFFEVCKFDPFYPQFPCGLGSAELQGTGFDTWDESGATSWLKTTAPVKGGEEVTIRFAIWDTGDESYDSTVLIDNFEWIASGGVNVGTVVVPDPK